MLVWACIAPHGGEVIPELTTHCPERMARTRAAMEELGRRCQARLPETLIVFTPRGLAIEGSVSVSVAGIAAGFLDGENGVRIGMRFEVDLELANAIGHTASSDGVPVVEIGYGADRRPIPVFPADWGVLVPMYFLGARWTQPPRIVVVCPDRSLPRRSLLAFGRASLWAARRMGRRIGIVCSADQGHGHSPDGPYGFAAQSASHDRAYCRAVADNALDRLLAWRNDRIEAALTDSYWQTLMLYGALRESSLRPELLSYEAPTYFGMACVSFDPEPVD